MHIVPLMVDWDGHDGDLQPPLCSSLEKQLYPRKSWERILISVVSQSQDYACVNDITLASSTFFSTYIWTEKFMNWSCWKSQITGPVRVICRCRFPPKTISALPLLFSKLAETGTGSRNFNPLKKFVFDTFSFQEFKIKLDKIDKNCCALDPWFCSMVSIFHLYLITETLLCKYLRCLEN